MSKVCMAAAKDSDRTHTLDTLKARFPEIPEQVISTTLSKHADNFEKCLIILSQESDRYLYGEDLETDSPVPVQPPPSAPLEPLSITIPPSTTTELPRLSHYIYKTTPLIPVTRPLTIAIPTPAEASLVSEAQIDRQPSVDNYSQKLIQHQQQRLDRITKELDSEKQKLLTLQQTVSQKEEELFNKKFRVADNPTKASISHLQEETEVLRTEIDQMAYEIDKINNGASPLGVINRENKPYDGHPHCFPGNPVVMPPRFRPPGPPYLRKSVSFPRSCSTQNPRPPGPAPLPMNGFPRFPVPHRYPQSGDEYNPSTHSPPRDPSLEGQGWIFVAPTDHSHPTPLVTTPADQPPEQDDTEQPWQCKHCTLENHGALNVCEACDMPRN